MALSLPFPSLMQKLPYLCLIRACFATFFRLNMLVQARRTSKYVARARTWQYFDQVCQNDKVKFPNSKAWTRGKIGWLRFLFLFLFSFHSPSVTFSKTSAVTFSGHSAKEWSSKKSKLNGIWCMMGFFDSCSKHSDLLDDTQKNRKWRGRMLNHRAFNPFGFQNILHWFD